MDKVYDQTKIETKWYKLWEQSGYFKPEINPEGIPYSIILPPPNANAPLHFGHAMFVVEDILIRYHRMKGYSALWLPGADHAGIETQVVFEKKLSKEGKSRFDFDRETLYKMIWDYVQENKSGMENQLRRLGFSLDWSREKFTLDPDIVKIVYQTFKKLFDDGLVYRGNRLVNYCTKMGTSFSDLEVLYIERKDPLYYIKYGPLVLATTRPETKFGDSAVAVHPDDIRYQKYIGKELEIEDVLGQSKIIVVGDKAVDPEFGTGVVKVTPAHDFTDAEIGQRHDLEIKQVINFDGRLNEKAGKFSGMKVLEARQAIVEELQQKELIEKIDENYTHRVATCYKCGTVLEPLPLEQWYLKVENLKQKAIDVVKKEQIKIFPKNYESQYFEWMEDLHDWNISRQPVWGIRIPAWYCEDCNKWSVTEGEEPKKCQHCASTNITQDSDTFDTWFSSGQWPVVTLKTGKPGDFEKFYPTSVMETGYDILKAWVSRMIMLGLYMTDEVPFHNVLLHGIVRDPLGQKMSKSKGNVVSPIEIADQYGADAARMALIFGTATGNDQSLSHPKLQAMRNFTNKLWNIGRFIIEFKPEKTRGLIAGEIPEPNNKDDEDILNKLQDIQRTTTKALEMYLFNAAAMELYEFIWHAFADKYIEKAKSRRQESQPILEYVFRTSLELLHPFTPFITEELWQKLPHEGKSIMITKWSQS
ncbi:valine--tRNA ligase [Candidatus Daviesbacteria bacterium]|nr:valine--tRNA ligase [Candidatus Daviesbacteria bacterium]